METATTTTHVGNSESTPLFQDALKVVTVGNLQRVEFGAVKVGIPKSDEVEQAKRMRYNAHPFRLPNEVVNIFGPVAERLGSGLQNRVHRFDSGRDLSRIIEYSKRLSASSTRFTIEML